MLHPITFKPTRFSTVGDLWKRSNTVLTFPNEDPAGILTSKNGHRAYIDFIIASENLRSSDYIGSDYSGPGVYLVPYIREKRSEELLHFWVVRPEENLTIAEVKKTLAIIQNILEGNEHLNSSSWTLDGKKNSLYALSDQFRSQYLNN